MTKISALSDIGTSVASNDTFVLVDVSDPTTPNKKIQQQNLFLIPDGSFSTPGLRFLNDIDSGIFRAGSNTFAIATGGSERLRIDSSGRLGIGTTSPAHVLDVSGGNIRLVSNNSALIFRNNYQSITTDSAGNDLTYRTYQSHIWKNVTSTGSVSDGTERMRIDSSGRLLVGTSSAYSQEVIGAAGFQPKIQVNSSSGEGVSIVGWRNTNNYPGFLWLARSNSDTIGTHALVTSGQNLGEILFSGSDGTDFENAASIRAEVDGTPGADDMPGRLVFSVTADNEASPTEAMRITNDRYVRLASGSGGIQFNGDTAAANALDDYEEGTFTPTLTSTNADTVVGSYQDRTGIYTKVGNLVTISIFLSTIVTTAGTGDVIITGLPFTSSATNQSSLSLSYVGRWTTQGPLAAGIATSSTTITLEESDSAVDPNLATPLSTTRLTTAAATKNVMRISGFYYV